MAAPFWMAQTARGFDGNLTSLNPEEQVTLAGILLPGICTLKAEPQLQVDRQKVGGGDGATLVERGYLPGAIEISMRIWTPPQWEEAQRVIATVWRKTNKSAPTDRPEKGKALTAANLRDATVAQKNAVDIDHVYTRLLGITSVLITGVSFPEPGPSGQDRIIRMKALEYVPPVAVERTKRITGSSRGAGGDVAVVQEFRMGEAPANATPLMSSETDFSPNGPPMSSAQGNY